VPDLLSSPARGSQPAPRATRGRAAGALLAGVAALVLTALTPGLALAWDANSFSSADEKLLIQLTNQSRAAAGLPALKTDSELTSWARWRSKDMIDRDYFSHSIPPDGKKIFDYLKADGYCYKVAGENIGINNFPDDIATQTIHQGFMDSPSHRANILGLTWTHIGVGAYKGADGTHVWTVLFSQKCAASPSPTPTPAPTPTPKPTPTPTPTPAPTSSTGPSPTPSASLEPTPSPSAAATPVDPAERAGRLGSGPQGLPWTIGGSPGLPPSPGTVTPGRLPEGMGLAVVDPAGPIGLLEAVVGDVAGGFLGD
jgi:uncharacterized protein YkwD